jgi:hypothetical protein
VGRGVGISGLFGRCRRGLWGPEERGDEAGDVVVVVEVERVWRRDGFGRRERRQEAQM